MDVDVRLSSVPPCPPADLDLPQLTLKACGRHLCVDLQPPMERLREVYKSLSYKLRIQSNGVERDQVLVPSLTS